jgi:hypothetical protein
LEEDVLRVVADGNLAKVSLGSDLFQTRRLLASAQGYAVLDRDGKRIGAFAEIVDQGQIAVRHDGTFVWRRRLLPIGTVASVVPERRLVLLSVDSQALVRSGRTWAAPKPEPEPTEMTSAPDWKERITQYAPLDEQRRSPSPEPGPKEPGSVGRHLLFISTSSGYVLVEREGDPPPLGADVEVPDQVIPFSVIKLGPSPLPNDPRRCAYLEPTEQTSERLATVNQPG